MIAIDEHAASVHQIIRDNLALLQDSPFPDFHRLLDRVLLERAHGSGHPPWWALPIFVCEGLNGDVSLAQHAAAALEIARVAAGCLDEWQDGDTEDALWQTLGAAKTVDLSVAMIALSFLTLTRLADLGASPGMVLGVKREFERTLLDMSEGQYADLGDNLSLEDYDTVAGAKSGALFRLGCRAGALIAGVEDPIVDLYGSFGYHLGILAQMCNDVAGLVGVGKKTDTEHRRSLSVVASQTLAQTPFASHSPEGQAGQLFAVVQMQSRHRHAAEALARCPAQGRLPLFLDTFSPRRLFDSSTQEGPEGEEPDVGDRV